MRNPYKNISLPRLRKLHDTKLRELHKLQRKDYGGEMLRSEIERIAAAIYRIKQEIACREQQTGLF